MITPVNPFSELHEARLADEWNQRNKPGTRVMFITETGEGVLTTTTSEAQVLFGQAVIMLAGFGGCCHLSQIKRSEH